MNGKVGVRTVKEIFNKHNYYTVLILIFYNVLYIDIVICTEGRVDDELKQRVMLERVEMIARLTTGGQARDREIALELIAELVRHFCVSNTGIEAQSIVISHFTER